MSLRPRDGRAKYGAAVIIQFEGNAWCATLTSSPRIGMPCCKVRLPRSASR